MFKKVHVFRVGPGEELSAKIAGYCRENRITSGVVIGIVGSVQKARLNFLEGLPARYTPVDFAGPLEIVAAQGSVALMDAETVIHIHIQLADKESCFGGHLAEATIFSTAEVVIGELDYQLHRHLDGYTGLKELAQN